MENVLMLVGASVFLLAIAGGAIMLVRLSSGPRGALDYKGGYLHFISFVTLLIFFFSLLNLVGNLLDWVLPVGSVTGWSREWMREATVQSAALAVVAFPVWLFCWRRARHMALQEGNLLLHRVYLYAVMIIAFVAGMVMGAKLISQPLRLLLGIARWTIPSGRRSLLHEAITGGVNALLAFGVWFYHWRLAEGLPSEKGDEPRVE